MKLFNSNIDKSSIKILCVDDEVFILTMLERVFSLAGYKVYLASTPQQGIEMSEKNEIDVLIADYQMPDMNGVEMIRKIQEQKPDIIKIILTGQANEVDLDKAIHEQLIEKWLLKPINPALLKAELEHLLFAA